MSGAGQQPTVASGSPHESAWVEPSELPPLFLAGVPTITVGNRTYPAMPEQDPSRRGWIGCEWFGEGCCSNKGERSSSFDCSCELIGVNSSRPLCGQIEKKVWPQCHHRPEHSLQRKVQVGVIRSCLCAMKDRSTVSRSNTKSLVLRSGLCAMQDRSSVSKRNPKSMRTRAGL